MLEKETEEDGKMEEREITSVEDVEDILTPIVPTRTTEETKLDRIMEMFLQMDEKLDKNKEEMNEK